MEARERAGCADRGTSPLAPKAPPRPAKAKRVLYLSMSGAPPQHDMFDPSRSSTSSTELPRGPVRGQAPRVHQGPPEAARVAPPPRWSIPWAPEVTDLLPGFREYAAGRVRRALDAHRPVQPRAGRDAALHGEPDRGEAEHRLLGHVGLGSSTRTCPGSSCWSAAGAIRPAARPSGPAASCPRSIRACGCAPRGTRALRVRSKRARPHLVRRRMLDACAGSTRPTGLATGTPRPRRVSPSTSWPTACRWPCPR